MSRPLKFLVAFIVALGLSLGVAAVASATVITRYGRTQRMPDCTVQTSVQSGNHAAYVQVYAGYSNCDLLVSDVLYGPRICGHVFNAVNGASSSLHCTYYVQNATANHMNFTYRCHLGDKLVVDVWLTSYRRNWQIYSNETRIRCGGGTW